MGVASAAQAVGGFAGQTSQTRAQNEQLAVNYNANKLKYELDNINRVGGYRHALMDVELAQDEAAMAASRAWAKKQDELSTVLGQLTSKDQDLQVNTIFGTGKANEGGRSANSGINQQNVSRRQRGQLTTARTETNIAAFTAQKDIYQKAMDERSKYWRQVSMGAGKAGPAPEMPKYMDGPSPWMLAIQLAGSALTMAAPMMKAPGTTAGAGAGPSANASGWSQSLNYKPSISMGSASSGFAGTGATSMNLSGVYNASLPSGINVPTNVYRP